MVAVPGQGVRRKGLAEIRQVVVESGSDRLVAALNPDGTAELDRGESPPGVKRQKDEQLTYGTLLKRFYEPVDLDCAEDLHLDERSAVRFARSISPADCEG